ncbi:MAG: hypothetical protein JO057_06830 [Chloroflexi bacterium]|nr:hypothetical protein [Chloroflexota bacterium]
MESVEDLFGVKTGPSLTMYMILYPELAGEDVMNVLDRVGVPGFTEFAKVTGRGPRGRHYDTNIWPGADGVIYCVVPSDLTDTLRQELAALNSRFQSSSNASRGLHVFTWACEQQI